MFRSRFFLSSTTKLTLYYTLIYPYIVYCNCDWSSTYVSNLNRIYYLQKRAVRAITNSDYRAHSASLFSKLGISYISKSIRLKSPNSYFIIEITYCLHCFLNLFVTNSQIHNYGTRTASNYRTHLCRTNLKQFTILYQGPNIWNSLPVSVTRSTNLLSFKTKMQEFLLK